MKTTYTTNDLVSKAYHTYTYTDYYDDDDDDDDDDDQKECNDEVTTSN